VVDALVAGQGSPLEGRVCGFDGRGQRLHTLWADVARDHRSCKGRLGLIDSTERNSDLVDTLIHLSASQCAINIMLA